MSKLPHLSSIVMPILQTYPEARGNDDLLVLAVYENLSQGITSKPMSYVFAYRKQFELPSTESIRRCRQKLQADYPSLRPSAEVQEARKEKEKEFYEFAVGGGFE